MRNASVNKLETSLREIHADLQAIAEGYRLLIEEAVNMRHMFEKRFESLEKAIIGFGRQD